MGSDGQITRSAAEVYDELFPSALFNEWPSRIIEIASLKPDMRVLDVACGTGVLTIAVADAISPGGALPFDDSSFDAVVSQFGLMFFENKELAIQEMLRVLRPSGNLTIAVWDSLENDVGYFAASQLLGRLFGDSAAESLRSPYSLGDIQELSALFSNAGAHDIKITTIEGKACYPSIRYWMEADIRGWTLADILDDEQFEMLVSEAENELAHLVTSDGSVQFSNPAHIVLQRNNLLNNKEADEHLYSAWVHGCDSNEFFNSIY